MMATFILSNDRNSEFIKNMTLMDDSFMTACFADNIECTELLLQIILNRNDIRVRDVHVQHELKNIQGKSSILDIIASDSDGKIYNIEVQKENKGASPKRARYHSSLIDSNSLPAGSKNNYSNLPEVYVIFITEKDIFRESESIYYIERTRGKNFVPFGDGSHIIYVNGENQDNTALGRLMHDFCCPDPDKMNYSLLAERSRYFKESEGRITMSGVFEQAREEGRLAGIEEGRSRGIEEGRSRGIEEGRSQGVSIGRETNKREVAKIMKEKMLSSRLIAECTGLSETEILKL